MAFDYAQYKEDEKQYIADNEHIFQHYNPHPTGAKVGDCVKRALTKATGKEYQEIQRELNRLKPITKSKKFNDNKNWEHYVEKVLDTTKLPQYRNLKIGDFCKLGLKGTFIISCRKHLVCVQDGILFDSWNSSFKAIGRVWKVN